MGEGLVVRAENSRSRGCWFESRCTLAVMQCGRKSGENRGCQMGQTTKKYLKINILLHFILLLNVVVLFSILIFTNINININIKAYQKRNISPPMCVFTTQI